MPARIGRTKRSEKGLLPPDNCAVALIDHQAQMMFGVAGVDRQSIINNTVALGKAARVFDVPVVLTTVETKSFSGNLWPQIRAVFPEQPAIERSSMNAWDDKNFVTAIEATGRKKLVLAGLWTEVCVTFPTVQAIHDGYEVYVVEDCCGDVSQLAHDNAMKRVIQAGAKPVTSLQVMLEFQRDWAEKDTYDAVMDIVKTHYGAYGVGVEYAYTMVHKDRKSTRLNSSHLVISYAVFCLKKKKNYKALPPHKGCRSREAKQGYVASDTRRHDHKHARPPIDRNEPRLAGDQQRHCRRRCGH